jgi:hypothetical protein
MVMIDRVIALDIMQAESIHRVGGPAKTIPLSPDRIWGGKQRGQIFHAYRAGEGRRRFLLEVTAIGPFGPKPPKPGDMFAGLKKQWTGTARGGILPPRQARDILGKTRATAAISETRANDRPDKKGRPADCSRSA